MDHEDFFEQFVGRGRVLEPRAPQASRRQTLVQGLWTRGLTLARGRGQPALVMLLRSPAAVSWRRCTRNVGVIDGWPASGLVASIAARLKFPPSHLGLREQAVQGEAVGLVRLWLRRRLGLAFAFSPGPAPADAGREAGQAMFDSSC